MDASKDEHRIQEIVDNFTSKLFYHGHPINRTEAREEVGLPTVENPSLDVEELIWRLYLEYEQEIRLEEPFQPAMELLAQHPALQPGLPVVTPLATAKLAFIESELVRARQTEDGVTTMERTGNAAIAKFRHETARPTPGAYSDPQLHTHALLMNITQRADGRWVAVFRSC